MLEIPAAAVVKLYTRMPPTLELILGIRLYVYMQHTLVGCIRNGLRQLR